MYYSCVCYSSTNLLVLGDSLSAGYRLHKGESWVDLLATKLEHDKYDIKVINASVSGATTADGLQSLPKLLEQYQPKILIVALGSNDGLRGNPVFQMQNNLGKIISLGQQHQAKVLLIGFKLPINYGSKYRNDFESVFLKLSKEYEVSLVPFLLAGFELDSSFFLDDRLHPTAAAQTIMLQNVWPQLEKNLPPSLRP